MNTENHMVIDLSTHLERMYGTNEARDREDYEKLKEATNKLLRGEKIEYFRQDYNIPNAIKMGHFGFDDVLVRVFECSQFHDEVEDFADCVKEILELYPDSKLSNLVKHMAIVTAADALDIDL